MGFTQAIKKGITGVQSAYARQKAAAEARAKQQMEAARTRLGKERVKANLEREKLVLQREMYEAKAAVNREREAVARAKAKSGGGGFGRFISETGKSYRKMQNAMYGPPPKKRRTVVRKRATGKRTTRR
jgi:hypothetical protein